MVLIINAHTIFAVGFGARRTSTRAEEQREQETLRGRGSPGATRNEPSDRVATLMVRLHKEVSVQTIENPNRYSMNPVRKSDGDPQATGKHLAKDSSPRATPVPMPASLFLCAESPTDRAPFRNGGAMGVIDKHERGTTSKRYLRRQRGRQPAAQ